MTQDIKEPTVESSYSKPQRRTLVKVLDELVRRVNQDVFAPRNVSQVEAEYKPLLRAMNEAERVLDRERQHNRIKRNEQL